MEFEIEDSFKSKIDLIIEKDFRELFGDDKDDENVSSGLKKNSLISPSKPEIKTALPLELHEIMVNLEPLSENDNPYNRLLTAIEIFHISKEEDDEADPEKQCSKHQEKI